MKPTLAILAMLAVATTASAPLSAGEFRSGDITVQDPWARPSAGNAPNGAGYMIVKNEGAGDDTLLSASSPVAEKTELHTHIREGDVMRMRPVEGGVAVPAKGEAAFKPGGLHVMLLGLKRKLKAGDTFPLTLSFRKAGDLKVEVKVGMPKMGGDHKHH